jgi:hypothetical protein
MNSVNYETPQYKPTIFWIIMLFNPSYVQMKYTFLLLFKLRVCRNKDKE